MPPAVKKTSTKPSAKASATANKSNVAAHPSWVEMIRECIIAHPEEARTGVSRPTIKKFVETRYRIELNATTASQLNRAITSGSEKGIFQLPKGPSGKVKLAPKARTDAAKENTKPIAKKPTASATKPKAASKLGAVKKPTALAKAATKPKAAKPPANSAKKSTTVAGAKKAPTKTPVKKTATTKKPTAAGKKTTTAKKSAVKKAITGETKKPTKPRATTDATKIKAKVPSAKSKSTTKVKPTSKGSRAKPSSKTKPTSKTEEKKAEA